MINICIQMVEDGGFFVFVQSNEKMKRAAEELSSSNTISPTNKKSKVDEPQNQLMDLSDIQRKIQEKQQTLAKIMAAKQKKAEREAAEKAQLVNILIS